METQENTQQDDILSFDTGKVDRSMPLLKEGLYDLEIKSVERKTNDKKGTESLHIKLLTTRDAAALDGSTLNKGWTIYHYIGLTPSEKRSKDKIRQDCAKFLDGVYGKNTNVSMTPLEAHVGKVVTCKLSIEEGDDDFGSSNRVKQFVPPAKTA